MLIKKGVIKVVIGFIILIVFGASYLIYISSKSLPAGESKKEPEVKLTEIQKHDEFIMDALFKKYGINFVIVGEGKYPNNHRYLKVSPEDHPELVIAAGAGKSFKTSGPVADFSDYGYRLTDDFAEVGGANYTKILKERYPNISFNVGGGGISFDMATIEEMRNAYEMLADFDPVRDNIMPFTLMEHDLIVSTGKYDWNSTKLDVAKQAPWIFFEKACKQYVRRVEKDNLDASTIPMELYKYIGGLRPPTVSVRYNNDPNYGVRIRTMSDTEGKTCVPHEQLFELLIAVNDKYTSNLRVEGHDRIIGMFNYFGYYQIYDKDGTSYGSPTDRCQYTWELDGDKFAMDDNKMGNYWKNGKKISLPMVTISHDNCDETTTAYYLEDVIKMLGDHFTYEKLAKKKRAE